MISCRPINSLDPPFLRCSLDTLAFDTIWANQKSITKILKVFNTGQTNARLEAKLLDNLDSCFSVNVNGSLLKDTRILSVDPNDSVYIFIEVRQKPSLAGKRIQSRLSLSYDRRITNIPIIVNVQDYSLLSGICDNDISLNDQKPYLVKDSFIVNSQAKMQVNSNVKIFFNKDAYIKVKGQITVNGQLNKSVVLQGSRLDQDYNDVAGQWNGLIIERSQGENLFDYCEIKNSVYGLVVTGSTDVILRNTTIQHNSYSNILVSNANLDLYNCVLGDCGSFSLASSGNCKLHVLGSTFANYWSAFSGHGIRNTPSISIQSSASSSFYMGNTIVYGNRSEGEFQIDRIEIGDNRIDNSLLKIDDSTKVFSKTAHCLFNPKFKFKKPYEPNYNYSLDTLSVAKDAGNIKILSIYTPYLDTDILGLSRLLDKAPDIGAFERKN